MKTISLVFLILLYITSANHIFSQKKEAVKLFNSGYDAEKSGDLENAVFFYNMAIDNDANYSDSYYRRGVVYYNMKNNANAKNDYSKALQLNPKHEGALMSIGQMNYDQKDYSEAIKNFTSVIEINPGNVAAYMNRGDVFYITSDYNSAAADYLKTVDLKPDHADALNMIEKLKTEYKVVIKQPEPPVTETSNETKSEETAVKTTYDGIVAEETKTGFEGNSGNEKSANVNTETAAEVKEIKSEVTGFESVSTIDLAEEHFQKGKAYTNAGNNFSAVKEYSEAVKLNPNHEKAYVNRGYIYSEMKQFDKAVSDYEKALAINPQSVFAYYSLGAVYVNKGNKDKAAEYFREAANLGDNDSKDWLKANGYSW